MPRTTHGRRPPRKARKTLPWPVCTEAWPSGGLGQNDASAKTLDGLTQVKSGEKHAATEFYAAGLLDLYDHRSPEAEAKLKAALDADPDFWPARLMLDRLGH